MKNCKILIIPKVSEMASAAQRQVRNFQAISWQEMLHFKEMMVVFVCVLDQHAYFDFYRTILLKQQFVGRHVVQLGHIILLLSQPVCAL